MTTVEDRPVRWDEIPERDKPDHAIFAALLVPAVLAVLLTVAAHLYYGWQGGSYTIINIETLTPVARAVYGIITLMLPAALGVFLSFCCLITFWRRRGRWWKSILLLALWSPTVYVVYMVTEKIPVVSITEELAPFIG